MSAKHKSKTLYPLEAPRVELMGETLYDRNNRQKSYFYLAIQCDHGGFYTFDQEVFYTKNNEKFIALERERN